MLCIKMGFLFACLDWKKKKDFKFPEKFFREFEKNYKIIFALL